MSINRTTGELEGKRCPSDSAKNESCDASNSKSANGIGDKQKEGRGTSDAPKGDDARNSDKLMSIGGSVGELGDRRRSTDSSRGDAQDRVAPTNSEARGVDTERDEGDDTGEPGTQEQSKPRNRDQNFRAIFGLDWFVWKG